MQSATGGCRPLAGLVVRGCAVRSGRLRRTAQSCAATAGRPAARATPIRAARTGDTRRGANSKQTSRSCRQSSAQAERAAGARSPRSARTARKLNQQPDRHRRAGARHRNAASAKPKRGSAAGQTRAADSRLARRAAAASSPRCWRRCSASAAARRRPCWCARRTRCNRCAPPCCSAPCCRRCAAQAEALATDLGELVRSAQGDRRRARPARASRPRSSRSDSVSARSLVEERQQQAERDREGAARRSGSAPLTLARQADSSQGFDRQDGAGPRRARPRAARQASRDRPRPTNGPRRPSPTWQRCSDPGRLAPAIAFADAKGLLPLPVNGVRDQANSAPPTALAAPKRAFRSRPGPAPRSRPRATAGWSMPDRSAPTDNS